jgi:hypothetical protein
MLGLSDYVHFSLQAVTPLVRDKLDKGFAHCVMAFDAAAIASAPGFALLPSNTKAWTSRTMLRPVTDPVKMGFLLRRRFDTGKLPGLELLALYAMDLGALRSISFASVAEMEMARSILAARGYDSLALTLPAADVRGYRSEIPAALRQYFNQCIQTGEVETPPDIPFD